MEPGGSLAASALRAEPFGLLRNPRKTECRANNSLAGLVVRAAPFALLRNSRKMSAAAKQFLPRLEVRVASFALLRSARKTECGRRNSLARLATRAAPFALLGISLFTTGCLFQKKQQVRVFHPPPPQPSKPINLKLPPVLDPPAVTIETEVASSELTVVGPGGPPFPPPPRPAPPTARRPQPPKPAVVPPVEAPATPQLAQIFTQEQLRENNKIIDDSLDRVQRALDALGKKNLNADQKDRVGLIRELQNQARQMREGDLASAVSLAKRADQLAKDLLDHLP
jgi:hypothetical protein